MKLGHLCGSWGHSEASDPYSYVSPCVSACFHELVGASVYVCMYVRVWVGEEGEGEEDPKPAVPASRGRGRQGSLHTAVL